MSRDMTGAQREVEEHFNAVAADYDHWKKKNWYYYETLYRVAKAHAAGAARLLDVGCGTGSMLRVAAPREGIGIDVSSDMITLARRANTDHPEYSFRVADIASFATEQKFDRILFFDVIEHVTDQPKAIKSLQALLTPGGQLVLTMANPSWEPILMFAEKRGLKMPEGPHYRMPSGDLLVLAKESGLRLVKREWHLIFPKYIPFFSWVMNEVVGRLPLIRRLSVVEVYVFTPA